MKTHTLVLIALACATTAFAATPEASREITIIVSPFQPPAERAQQQTMLQKFILADTPNGAHVVVSDGWALTDVCDAQLPRLSYDSVNARAPRVAESVAALGRWYAGLDAQPTPAGLKNSSAVRIPESLAAATARPATSQRTIVILAAPWNVVPTGETSFSMIGPGGEPRYPSDAHLNAGADKSIYNVADKRGRLTNTTVLWSYGTENLWTSPNARQLVSRWWCLYTASQGGTLGAFNADTPQIMLAAARANHRAIGEYAVNPDDDAAVVMHTVAQREIPVRTQVRPVLPQPAPQPVATPEPPPAPPVVIVTPPPAPPVSPAPAPEPEPTSKPTEERIPTVSMPVEIPKPAVGNIGIAAVWSAQPGTDVDLWVAAKPGMPEAFWNRMRVPRVTYFRDIRTAQTVKENAQWRAAWEYVEIEAAQISEPTCWLNLYEARGPVRGILRLQFNGHVVDRPFEFNVTSGNRGRDANLPARSRSPYWQRVNLMDFLQTPPTQTAGRLP